MLLTSEGAHNIFPSHESLTALFQDCTEENSIILPVESEYNLSTVCQSFEKYTRTSAVPRIQFFPPSHVAVSFLDSTRTTIALYIYSLVK